jgi:amino acid transporter
VGVVFDHGGAGDADEAGVGVEVGDGGAAAVAHGRAEPADELAILVFQSGLWVMLDLATTLSFLTAPVLAVINYLVITRLAPEEARPGRWMRWLSIGFLGVFSVAYVVWLIMR